MEKHRLKVENGPPGTRSKGEPSTLPCKYTPILKAVFQLRFMVSNFEYRKYSNTREMC